MNLKISRSVADFERYRLALALVAASALVPTAALAQSQKPPVQNDTPSAQSDQQPPGPNAAPASSATPASQSAVTTVDEIVVTAQKRSESIVNVPISVTALSGDTLNRSGVDDMSSLAQLVPGLHMDQAGPYLQPSIRGVSSALANPGVESNVAIYIDGIYQPNELANDFNFVDVSGIEVLKGPQGTLFGRNSTGGAILVTTRAPSQTPTLEVTAGYGSFDTVSGSIYASTGISDKLSVALAIGGENSDGFRTNLVGDADADPMHDVQGRLKFLYSATDQLKFALTLNAFRMDDPSAWAFSAYKGESDAALFGVPLSVGYRDQVSLEPGYAHVVEGYGLNLRTEDDLGFADLTSLTSAQWDDGHENENQSASMYPSNGTLPESALFQDFVENADWRIREKTYSQEFDLSSISGGPLDWTVGLFGYYDSTTYNTFNLQLYGPFGPGGELTGGAPNPTTGLFPSSAYVSAPSEPLFKSTEIAKSVAAFVDATYKLGRWHFTLGGRYALDTAEVRYTGIPSIADGFSSAYLTNSHNFYALTPRGVLRYSITPRSNVYISYSEGTKSGLFNASGYLLQPTPVGQERIRDVEAGYKVEGHDWHLETSAYHYNYTNLQVATYIGGAAFLQNAPAAEIYGFDAHFEKTLLHGLDLDAGFAYTHAKYTDFPDAAFQYFSTLTGETNTVRSATGNTLQRAPAETGYVSLNYRHDLYAGVLSLNATGSYQSVSYFDFANTLKDNPHGILNLRADWTAPSGRWTLSLIGRNVTNTTYLTQVIANAGGFGADYGRPASITGQMSFKY
jgi:iron complex outermembrane receptor protein